MSEPTGKMVSIAKFLEPFDAQLAKGLLESNGIPCFLQGEQANNIFALGFRARLLVDQADEATARELLANSPDTVGDDAGQE